MTYPNIYTLRSDKEIMGSTYTRKRKNARMMKYGAIAMGLILVVMHLISWGWV